MPKSEAVWALDIGQCSLKALRCLPDERPDRLVADAFDYIEYPKILSQPGAEPAQLVSDALKEFLSRNTLKGDRVALGVPGQTGLARFIKLPPVEKKKIPAIVYYEAKQQIPFDLADVVWDYQRMGGDTEEEGFALETEIGLFAMKREQVFRILEPLTQAGIEVDLVQLAPLALYNFLVFDQMPDLGPPEEYDPENPPPSVVLLSMGTDATDLIVTNGYRVWQRSIPIGGNHFTKALTKELRLTFAKAEHLKRNVSAAEDPKALFQAMRPVFQDFLTEVQRSLTFFSNLNRKAHIGRVVAMGNAFKLPGLRKYLSQGLGYEVQRIELFRGLVGPQVLHAPAFKENMESFGVCYGLAVQALGKGLLRTNLLPKEILQDRLIRDKKPWAVAAAAVLMLASTLSFVSWTRALGTVEESAWKDSQQKAQELKQFADNWKQQIEQTLGEFQRTDQIGQNLVGNVERRILWAELLYAINECLPGDRANPLGQPRPIDPKERNEIYIESIEAQRVDRLEDWYAAVQGRPPVGGPASSSGEPMPTGSPGMPGPMGPSGPVGPPAPGGAGGTGAAGMVPGAIAAPPAASPPATPALATAPAGASGTEAATTASAAPGPSGPGWVVRLTGYHFHNYPPQEAKGRLSGLEYVQRTLIENLRSKTIELPVFTATEGSTTGKKEKVTMKELGIEYPVLVEPKPLQRWKVPHPKSVVAEMLKANQNGTAPKTETPASAEQGTSAAEKEPTGPTETIDVLKYPFTVEFVWRPTPPSKRAEERQKALQAQAAQQPSSQISPEKPTM
ncbi:MAG: pilus assembly protein PilM [Thermoguttaceae bacterium]|nr:pilus assembly protein PilM [Thermoguttaceae bacterium]MDW8039712.1 pilus assembly protein PilM [Thermoguttaceae bacterium]